MFNNPVDLSEDKEWLIQLQQSNEIAFRNLYKKYSVRVLKRLIRLLKDEEIAKEVLQDVFLKIWERREMLNPEKSFRSYLFQIAENRVTDIFRKVKSDIGFMNHIIYLSTELYHHTEQVVEFKESNAMLEQAIDNLPPRRREVFRMCKIEGKSYEEVANLLGISTGSVNDHMVKALRAVRQYLKNNDIIITALFAYFFQNLE